MSSLNARRHWNSSSYPPQDVEVANRRVEKPVGITITTKSEVHRDPQSELDDEVIGSGGKHPHVDGTSSSHICLASTHHDDNGPTPPTMWKSKSSSHYH